MKLLDRYILKRFLTSFLFVVLIIMAVIVVIDITEKIEDFNKHEDLTLNEIIFDYYLNFIPFMADLITPITTFITVVFVTSKMAGHTELIAILSSGVSFRRLLMPYMLGGLIIAGTSFALKGWVIPQSNKTRLEFEIKYLKNPYFFDKRNIHIQVAPDVSLYLSSYNNRNNSGHRFTMERFDGTELKEKLSASSIKWNEEKGKWTIKDWKHRKIDSLTETITQGREIDSTLAIHPKEFQSDYRNFDGMTIEELDEQIERLRNRGATNVEVYEVEKYLRTGSPFAVIILTFMGVIVSSRKSRGGTGFQIALGFMIAFVYIIFVMLSKSLSESGSIPPALTVWLPNIIFMIISGMMYKYVPR